MGHRWPFVAAALIVLSAAPATGQSGAKVGLLSCNLGPSA